MIAHSKAQQAFDRLSMGSSHHYPGLLVHLDSSAWPSVLSDKNSVDCLTAYQVRCKFIDGLLQDKSGSPVAIQPIDMACLSPCRSVGARAASGNLRSDFNAIFGTVDVLSVAGALR